MDNLKRLQQKLKAHENLLLFEEELKVLMSKYHISIAEVELLFEDWLENKNNVSL